MALERIFSAIYKYKNIRFEFTDGDLTSDIDSSKTNVSEIIYSKVYKYIHDNKLRKTDIWQIVHILDTDGTYIPDQAIVEGETPQFVYTTTSIACRDVQRVKEHNYKKSDMMDYLLTLKEIHHIPYKCYFMSCNLDHALYDRQNLDKEDKIKYADAFYEVFIGKEKLFIEFLTLEAVNGVPSSFPPPLSQASSQTFPLHRPASQYRSA